VLLEQAEHLVNQVIADSLDIAEPQEHRGTAVHPEQAAYPATADNRAPAEQVELPDLLVSRGSAATAEPLEHQVLLEQVEHLANLVIAVSLDTAVFLDTAVHREH